MEEIKRFLIYLFVFLVFMIALSIISPSQASELISIFQESGEVFLVLLLIAFVIYILRRTERL